MLAVPGKASRRSRKVPPIVVIAATTGYGVSRLRAYPV